VSKFHTDTVTLPDPKTLFQINFETIFPASHWIGCGGSLSSGNFPFPLPEFKQA